MNFLHTHSLDFMLHIPYPSYLPFYKYLCTQDAVFRHNFRKNFLKISIFWWIAGKTL